MILVVSAWVLIVSLIEGQQYYPDRQSCVMEAQRLRADGHKAKCKVFVLDTISRRCCK